MQVQVHYQGMDSSEWIDQFITRKISKLNRYLNEASAIHVHLKLDNRNYATTLEIHCNHHRNYAFHALGGNLYESFSMAIDKASRVLNEEKRRFKDRINSRYYSLKKQHAA